MRDRGIWLRKVQKTDIVSNSWFSYSATLLNRDSGDILQIIFRSQCVHVLEDLAIAM